jgi:phage terminase small subunit
MKGRKPKPTGLRLIEGNREHRTIHQDSEPKPAAGEPPRPDSLSPAALEHWDFLIDHLRAMNILAMSDQGLIMSAAMAFGQASEIQREVVALSADIESLRRAGDGSEADIESMKLAFKMGKQIDEKRRLINTTLATLSRFEADLGLSPTARTRIKIDKPQPKSKRERLLS